MTTPAHDAAVRQLPDATARAASAPRVDARSPHAGTEHSGVLWNPDLAPVPPSRRTWGVYNYAALWTTFSINIATYLVASGLIAGGMNWKQAIFTIALGHLIILVPILLNAHAGAKFGVPFPVYSRAAFGVMGANVPAVLRALVACGWFGIQTWVGGTAINAVLGALIPAWKGVGSGPMICFLGFWALNVAVTLRGIETIRILQGVSAPFLTGISLLLLGWAWLKAGSFGTMLSAPSTFKSDAEFYAFFVPSLTGVVAHWAAIALNISDFTRYATSQRAQLLGQAVSLPITMTVYSFIAIAVTTATVVIFGEPVWDPVAVISRFGSPLAVAAAALALVLATLNVNVAANIVSPANDFSNLYPKKISFKMGGVITCVIGLFMQPWKLLANHGNFIIGWLVGYSSFLGPVAGVLIADYFVIRRTELDVDDLYRRNGRYEYAGGVNLRAVTALGVGIACALAGLLAKPAAMRPGAGSLVQTLAATYDYAWFIGFAVSFLLYLVLMRDEASRLSSHGLADSAGPS
ncbi:MAG: NCS1 family nucleobase:cation symporter-1 [Vicinamibacterales bacterium]